MNLVTRLLLPLAAVSALAAPAYAQSYRIPVEGSPAIQVDKQAGWTENYDAHENLTFFASDGSGGLLFRVIEAGPEETMPDSGQIAEIILGAAGANPYTSRQPSSFAGGAAEAFVSTMAVKDGPLFDIIVVIRKVDDRHLAVGVKMIPQSTAADKRKLLDAQFAKAQIVTR